jgi:hydrogenase expression/formation protein HypC
MCIGVPMQLVADGTERATCAGRGQRETLDLMLVGPQPAGTWVLAFRGAAMRVMTDAEASQTDAALDALESVLAGDGNVDAHFADLVDREPVLPDHLKGPAR